MPYCCTCTACPDSDDSVLPRLEMSRLTMLDSSQVCTMTPREELLALPVADKIDLIELLWDSLSADQKNNLPVPDWHREELDRRLDQLEKNPDDSIPWEDVRRRLMSGE